MDPSPRAPADEDLVRRVRAGEQEAFRDLVRRHQERLYRYACRMCGDGDTAMDLVQEALIQSHRRLAQCREPGRYGHWVFAILVNGCRHHARRRREHLSLDERLTSSLPGGESPWQAAERGELRDRLAAALSRLPAEQREAFLLRHMEGLSYDEMASLSGSSAAALRQRVHRAREALEGLLREVAS